MKDLVSAGSSSVYSGWDIRVFLLLGLYFGESLGSTLCVLIERTSALLARQDFNVSVSTTLEIGLRVGTGVLEDIKGLAGVRIFP